MIFVDSKNMLISSGEEIIKIWDMFNFTHKATLKGHTGTVTSLAYQKVKHKDYLVSAANDLTIKVWDLNKFSCVKVLRGHTNPNFRLYKIESDWNAHMYSVCILFERWDGDEYFKIDLENLKLIPIDTAKVPDYLAQSRDTYSRLDLHEDPNGQKYFITTNYCSSFYKILNGEIYNDKVVYYNQNEDETMSENNTRISALTFFNKNKQERVLVAYTLEYRNQCQTYKTEEQVALFDTDNKRRLIVIQERPCGMVEFLKVEMKGLLYIIGLRKDSQLELWNSNNLQCKIIISNDSINYKIQSIVLIPYERSHLCAISCDDNKIRLLEKENFEHINFPQSKIKCSLFYHFNEKSYLILGLMNGNIQVWQYVTDKNTFHWMRNLIGTNDKFIDSIVHIPSDINMVAAASNYIIKLWYVDRGDCLYTFQHSSQVSNLKYIAFADKHYLTALSSTFVIWDLNTGDLADNFITPTYRELDFTYFDNSYKIFSHDKYKDCLSIWNFEDKSFFQNYEYKYNPNYFNAYYFVKPHFFFLKNYKDCRILDATKNEVISFFTEEELEIFNPLYIASYENGGRFPMIAYSNIKCSIKLVNIPEEGIEYELKGHFTPISKLIKFKIGLFNLIASGDKGGLIKLWNILDGRCLGTLDGQSPLINDIYFYSKFNNNCLLSCHPTAFNFWLINCTKHFKTVDGYSNFLLHQP